MALTRAEIVTAALEILDAYGLGDLSMRRIAGVLGVRAGALYHHIPNKQSLLAALSDAILAGLPELGEGDLRSPLIGWAQALRTRLLAHRDGAELVASVLSLRMGEISPIGQLAGQLTGRSAQPETVAAALVHWTVGHVMDEQGHAQLVALGVIDADEADPQQAFTAGARLIVAGLV